MAGYGRDYRGYDAGYRPLREGGAFRPGGRQPSERAASRSGRYRGGLEIGPVWGGGSDISYRAHPVGEPRYDRSFGGRVPAARSSRGGRRDPRVDPRTERDWWYW